MSSYVRWIRQYLGRQKILLVYASACIRDDNGRLLWQRRGDFGWWGLPGGVLELDESLPECVVREAREETGLDVEPVRLVGIYSSPDFDVTYPNGDQVQQVTVCFECPVAGGRLQADGRETIDLAWFALNEQPPTVPWYASMATDLAQGQKAATFRAGNSGNGRSDEPYFKWIRQAIGRAAYVMPAAVGFVQDEAGRVLLHRRGDNGQWSLPGGGMELGERVDQTVVAEVREETGLHVEPVHLVGIYSDDSFRVVYPSGDELKIVSSLFRCRITGGRLRADGIESLEVRFFAPDSLPSLAARHVRRVQDALANREEAVF